MWRVGELATEGVRNLHANLTRSFASLLFVAVAIGGLMYAEQRVADDLTRFTNTVTADGGQVVVVSTPGPSLSTSACNRIGAFGGVVATGAVLDRGATPLRTAGGALVSDTRFSAGAVSVIDPTYRGQLDGGYLAGPRAAERFTLVPGTVAVLGDQRPAAVVGMLDEGTRIERYETALLAAGRFEAGHQCLIEMTPGNLDAGRQIAAASFVGAEGIEIRTLLAQSAFERDVVTELDARPMRWMWLIVAFMIAASLAVQMFLRRGERAVYVAHGAGRADLAIVEAFESLPLILVGAAIGITWATAVAAITGITPHVGFGLRLSVAAVGAAIAAIAAISLMLYPRRALADQLKGR